MGIWLTKRKAASLTNEIKFTPNKKTMLFKLFKNLKLYKDLNYQEFVSCIQQDSKGIILDVRNSLELKESKIKGAINIDVTSPGFADAIKSLSKDKNYYVYCRSGTRSSKACRIMSKSGFKNLYNLKGGIMSQ